MSGQVFCQDDLGDLKIIPPEIRIFELNIYKILIVGSKISQICGSARVVDWKIKLFNLMNLICKNRKFLSPINVDPACHVSLFNITDLRETEGH